jgi:cytochrome c oxidase subunit IV
MSDNHSPEYYKKKFIPLIYLVGGILIAGTMITFAADLMGVFKDFTHAIIFALTVAVVKASAVIYIFMHLKWDINLKTISLTLGCTVIFLIGMMVLTVGSEIDANKPGHAENTWNHVGKPEPIETPEKQ